MTDFVIKALAKKPFDDLMKLTDRELMEKQAKWIVADESPGFPCRVSLVEAAVGERVLALPFMHHDADSPYRASGPIFVRENAKTAMLSKNQIPEILQHRLLSVRAYNTENMMISAEVINGDTLEVAIKNQFSIHAVEYLQIHNAKQGCFNCSVYRV